MAERVLEMRNIRKSYGPVSVLRDVGLTLDRGEVRCVAGENGSGKSTMIKILSGIEAMDSGEVELFGKPVPSDPHAIIEAGLSVIYQDFALFPNLTVGENITFLSSVARGARFYHRPALRRLARRTIERMNLRLDLDTPVERLSVADKQLVAIARALANEARIMVMDEPTTALTRKEVATLLRRVADLKAHGVAFLFVSHKLEEIFSICDSVTALRDGTVVAEGPTEAFTQDRLVKAMTGRAVDKQRLARDGTEPRPALLTTRGLLRHGAYEGIDLDLYPGTILSVVGLLGSGRTELALTLFGALSPDAGDMRMDGQPVRFSSVTDAMTAGIAYLPEDRLTEGLFLAQPIRDNIVVSSLDQDARAGWLDSRALTRRAKAAVDRFRIKSASVEAPVAQLSGGNQQRVVLARLMERRPRLIILNGPTVGVDVGSKRDIHEILIALRRDGVSVLVVTDDIPEAIAVSDRIFVMSAGRLTARFDGEEATEQAIYAEVTKEFA